DSSLCPLHTEDSHVREDQQHVDHEHQHWFYSVNLLPDWLVFAGATIGVNLWIICLGAAQLRGAPARTSQAIAQ
ncbi:hypothetical protein ACWCSH_37505, partial [Streptosporangium sp. NPDC001682]